MAKEWTDEEVQKAIGEAVQIVREDRIDTLIRNRLSAPPSNSDDTKDKAPESGSSDSGGNADPNPKRKSLWWGDTE